MKDQPEPVNQTGRRTQLSSLTRQKTKAGLWSQCWPYLPKYSLGEAQLQQKRLTQCFSSPKVLRLEIQEANSAIVNPPGPGCSKVD